MENPTPNSVPYAYFSPPQDAKPQANPSNDSYALLSAIFLETVRFFGLFDPGDTVEVVFLALGVLKNEPLVGFPLRCLRRLLRKRGREHERWSVTHMEALLLNFRVAYFQIFQITHSFSAKPPQNSRSRQVREILSGDEDMCRWAVCL